MTGSMAILTNKRNFLAQQFTMVASVGFVTGKAVLLNRRMLPQERSSLFGVAFVTELIQRIRP